MYFFIKNRLLFYKIVSCFFYKINYLVILYFNKKQALSKFNIVNSKSIRYNSR